MNYQTKSAIQWAMSLMPGSNQLNRFMQLYVTRSLPVSQAEFQARVAIAERHVDSAKQVLGHRPASILDIGSGADLAIPILMARSGAKVTASDVNRLASARLIQDMLSRCGMASMEAAGLRYVVYDPPQLPFPDGAFDLITSTSVLEHVPRDQIQELAREIHRLLKPGATSSHHIAHKDHWSDSDPSLHDMNYLRFDDQAWRRFNPPLLHQNRLLSSQYVQIFQEAGFAVEHEVTRCRAPDFAVAERFKSCPAEDHRITHTWLRLRKP